MNILSIILVITLLSILYGVYLRYCPAKIIEEAIEFEPPHMTGSANTSTIGELMRIGTQANENATYDTVDTNLLKKPKKF